MALGMNELRMDLLGQNQDGTSSGWICWDKFKMERAQDGFIGIESKWNKLKMDSLGRTQDATSSGWIRRDGLPT
ncbi:unnamed protein product [Sphagnum jensenii]|uniref:Uncharacterized protein n=1 Tax=Sphagnum jensenii TaxID=128206 RepID=A0ABP1BF41_9BRYO